MTIRTNTLVALALAVLLSILALAACGGQGAGSEPDDDEPAVAMGDATRGEALFTSAGCAGCHSTGANQIVGPGLAGVFAAKGPYGDKLPNGEPINEENMAEWIKIGGVGTIGQMPGNNILTDQELADIVAYLKTLE